MRTEEERIATALRGLADRDALPAPPLDVLMRRGRRTKHARLAVISAAGSGLVAVVVAVTTIGVGGHIATGVRHSPANGADVAASKPTPAQSPVALGVAAGATARTSFRVKFTTTLADHRGTGPTEKMETYTGVFDLQRRRGQLRDSQGVDYRLVEGDCYVDRGGWRKEPDCALIFVANRSSIARAVSTELVPLMKGLQSPRHAKYAGRSGTGAAAVDIYAISPARNVVGKAEVGVASGKITKVSLKITVTGPRPEIADRTPMTFMSVVELSDYGIPVQVERP